MQGISRRAAITVSVFALLTLPLGTLIARAHSHTYRSNLTIHWDKKTDTFEGHVGTASFCQEGRRITVRVSGTNAVVGSTTSGHAGQWVGVSAPGPGTYYATVDETSDGGYGADHRCLGDTSNTVTVR